MEDVDLSFLLWIVDPRPMKEMKEMMEKIMKIQLHVEEADRPLDERMDSFEAQTMGLYVSLQRDPSWTDENLYRFAGCTLSRIWSSTGQKVSIDSHLARTLAYGGIKHVMSREQFVAFKKARRESTRS
jgi:hypothetical protein